MTSTLKCFFYALALACMSLFAGHTLAHGSDQEQIEHAMMATFDKPNNPLKVAPVVVQGDYAVAGWTQGDKGGRALLQKTHDHWEISVCGGDGLTQAKVLETTGMPAATAKALASAVLVAESKLTAHQKHLFGSFEGMTQVGADHAQHGAHDAHAVPAQ
jgi:hypothetical protein